MEVLCDLNGLSAAQSCCWLCYPLAAHGKGHIGASFDQVILVGPLGPPKVPAHSQVGSARGRDTLCKHGRSRLEATTSLPSPPNGETYIVSERYALQWRERCLRQGRNACATTRVTTSLGCDVVHSTGVFRGRNASAKLVPNVVNLAVLGPKHQGHSVAIDACGVERPWITFGQNMWRCRAAHHCVNSHFCSFADCEVPPQRQSPGCVQGSSAILGGRHLHAPSA